MVPITDTHTANGVIEPDRVLMISGSLSTSNGNSSSALFDGQSVTPYFVSTSSTGAAGSVSSLFHSFASFSFDHKSKLVRFFPFLYLTPIRIPGHRCRYSYFNCYCCWSCLSPCSYWYSMDLVLSQRRQASQVRCC